MTFGIGDSIGVYQGDARFGPPAGPVASPLIAADARQAATAMSNEPARAASAALLSRDGPGAMGRRAR